MSPLNPKTFSCSRCGQCCRPIVVLSEEDIARIEKSGIQRNDFVGEDPINKQSGFKVLKQKKNVCMFLKKEGEEYVCSIYNQRPGVCRKYPFMEKNQKLEDCKPRNWKRWMKIENSFH